MDLRLSLEIKTSFVSQWYQEIVAALFQKTENMAVGIRCADYATLSIRKT
jgi:hypothetical protein